MYALYYTKLLFRGCEFLEPSKNIFLGSNKAPNIFNFLVIYMPSSNNEHVTADKIQMYALLHKIIISRVRNFWKPSKISFLGSNKAPKFFLCFCPVIPPHFVKLLDYVCRIGIAHYQCSSESDLSQGFLVAAMYFIQSRCSLNCCNLDWHTCNHLDSGS